MPIITSDRFFVVNATDQDRAKLDMALAYMQMSQTFANEIREAVNNGRIVTIEIVHNGNDTYSQETGKITWDPNSALGVIDYNGNKGVQSPALGLAHEFAHANDLTSPPSLREAYATWKETVIAQELNEPTRATHNDVYSLFEVRNPTLHTTDQYDDVRWTEKEQNGSDTIGGEYIVGSSAPILGETIEPTPEPVCFGYWLSFEDPLYPEGSGRYVTVWIADPVILNLTGESVSTQSASASGVHFDMQGNGQQFRTGWITSGEGFLIYDKNSTGSVGSDKDLVAGLGVLRAIDSNGDGHLNQHDVEWSKLKLWKDEGLDGVFQTPELFTLTELGIADIDLHYTAVNRVDQGNTILNVSTFTWENGTQGDIASVELVALSPPVTV